MKKLVLLALLAVACVLAIWLGLPQYRHWKQVKLTRLAADDLRKGDTRTAMLRARSIMAMNDLNPAGYRIMADALEALHLPNELEFRQRVVELVPNSTPDRLALVRCASGVGENALALQALKGIRGSNDLNTVEYNTTVAVLLAHLGNIPLAEHHLAEAAQFDPTNRMVQLDTAVFHLTSRDPRQVSQALQTLEQLTDDPVYRMDALRDLVTASVRANDADQAKKFSAELVADPQAGFADRMMRLGVLNATKDPDFTSVLEKISAEAEPDQDKIYALAEWMYQHDMADLAVAWLDGLPAATREKTTVQLARADGFIVMKDWVGLATRLEGQNWNDWDFIRDAMLTRASREQRLDFKSQNDWLAAVQAASGHAQTLSDLIRLVSSWGWIKEREELLWTMIKKFPAQRWAMDALNQNYIATGDTRGVQKLSELIVSYDSGNYVAKNDLAMSSLLLNTEVAQAQSLATEVYAHDSTNPNFASTQAYSLYSQGKVAEALKAMEDLKPAQLEQPNVALYYGLVLSSNGQKKQAQKYFKLAETGKMLPEETALLNHALGRP